MIQYKIYKYKQSLNHPSVTPQRGSSLEKQYLSGDGGSYANWIKVIIQTGYIPDEKPCHMGGDYIKTRETPSHIVWECLIHENMC